MTTARQKRIREVLKAHPDGATSRLIADRLGLKQETVQRNLHAMPDTYIDRWLTTGTVPAAVWIAVEVPENCPRPEKLTPEERHARRLETKRRSRQRTSFRARS